MKQPMAMKSNNKTEGSGTREDASSLVQYIVKDFYADIDSGTYIFHLQAEKNNTKFNFCKYSH